MTVRVHSRLLPGTPWWVVLVAVPLPLTALAAAMVLGPASVVDADRLTPSAVVPFLVLQAAFCALLVWRARTLPQ